MITARTLITSAYYLSGVTAQGFEVVSGDQISTGLELLNEIITFKTAEQSLIPYFTSYNFNFVAGQQSYFIPNLVSAETFTYFIGDVRYSVVPVARKQFRGTSRADVNSLPFQWNIERGTSVIDGTMVTGSYISVYFFPESAYNCEIWGKFSLTEIPNIDENLSDDFSKFYLDYLKYLLAQYICNTNLKSFPPQAQARLNEYERILIDVSPMDLTTQKVSSLQMPMPNNYAIANLSNGWLPSWN